MATLYISGLEVTESGLLGNYLAGRDWSQRQTAREYQDGCPAQNGAVSLVIAKGWIFKEVEGI